jgi:translation initiation factor IF-3
VNERIRAREIRLIGADGEQLGVVTPDEGRARAEEEGYDLVEVAPNASPPVCRIMDYGKYKYEQKKKAAAGKAKGRGRAASLKEVKMRPSTDDHDLAFKLKNARRFLIDGDKVKVTVMFRGREMAHRRNGYAKLDQVKELLGELVSVENPPQMTGRFLSMILVPNREAVEAAKKKAAQEEAAQEEAARQAEGSEGGAGELDA